MRAYTVQEAPFDRPGSCRLIPEGFSVWGFLLGPLWLLRHGAWPFAIAAAAAWALAPWAVWPGVAVLTGLCGHDARRAMLAWRGWRLAGVVLAGDRDQAEMRWFDRRGMAALEPIE